MRRVIFSLIGEQTAPNLFVHLHFEPDVHCLLHSRKTERQSEDLAEAIRMWAEQNRKDVPEIPLILLEHENDWKYVNGVVTENMSKLARDQDSEFILNITSGTKPMNIGMWEARGTIPETTVVYLDGTYVRYIGNKVHIESLGHMPSISVFVRAYGYTIKETTPPGSSDLTLLIKTSEVVAGRPDIRKCLAEKGWIIPETLLPKELAQSLIRAGFVLKENANLHPCKEDVFRKKHLKTLEHFWGGDWLSLFVWNIIKEEFKDMEVLLGTKLTNVSGKSGENEVDVMFFKDWKLYCVECKVSKQTGKNEPFYKIKQVTKDLGGIFAVPVLVTTRMSGKAYYDDTVRHAVLSGDTSSFRETIIKIVSG